MREKIGLSAFIGAAILALVCSAYPQSSGGVFVGRGQVSRKNGPSDRASSRASSPPETPRVESPRAETPRVESPRVESPRAEREIVTDDDLLEPSANAKMLQEVEELETQCLNEVNRLRQKHNVAPLQFSEDLLQVARNYSRRMAEENFFSHNDPDGRSVRERVDEASIKWRVVGENLATSNGYINPVAVSLHGWMESPGHRRNLLDPDWRQTAIGVWISDNGTVYFTEIFLTR